ncbi:hypothetical protein D9M70_595390 [compost metagenome]
MAAAELIAVAPLTSVPPAAESWAAEAETALAPVVSDAPWEASLNRLDSLSEAICARLCEATLASERAIS